jgi:hypothetical protein
LYIGVGDRILEYSGKTRLLNLPAGYPKEVKTSDSKWMSQLCKIDTALREGMIGKVNSTKVLPKKASLASLLI